VSDAVGIEIRATQARADKAGVTNLTAILLLLRKGYDGGVSVSSFSAAREGDP